MRRAATRRGLNWVIESAGTHARETTAHPLAITVLKERLITVRPSWRARPLSLSMIEQADLILVAAAEHRRAVATLSPRAVRRTFLFRQMARLAAGIPAIPRTDPRQVGESLVEAAIETRGEVHSGKPGAEDIKDPIGGNIRDFRQCAVTLQAAIAEIFRPVSSTSPATRGEAAFDLWLTSRPGMRRGRGSAPGFGSRHGSDPR